MPTHARMCANGHLACWCKEQSRGEYSVDNFLYKLIKREMRVAWARLPSPRI
jgi:hypothetical protein